MYDGTQSCTTADFLPFFLFGIGVMVFFVVPIPVILCIVTVKRCKVRTTQYNGVDIYAAFLNNNLVDHDIILLSVY